MSTVAPEPQRRAATALAADVTPSFQQQQASSFDHLRLLPIADFRYDRVRLADRAELVRLDKPGAADLVSTESATSRGDHLVVTVSGTYRLSGFGAQRHFTRYLTLTRHGAAPVVPSEHDWDHARFSSDTDGPTQLQMWDLPDMRVARGTASLVVGNVSQARLRGYARMADHAVSTVSRLWGRDWSRSAVLVAPARSDELLGLEGEPVGGAVRTGQEQVSAVTTGPVDDLGRSRADQVMIAPSTWDQLVPEGRQVVITHELTHVATGWSTVAPVPRWLSEGLAEYLAYAEVRLPRDVVAAALLDRAKAGTFPGPDPGFPTDAEFDPATHDIAVSDNAAWLLCSVIADAHGREGLMAFYRRVAGWSTPSTGRAGEAARHTSQAVRDVLGVSEDQLLHQWLGEVDRLSRQVA